MITPRRKSTLGFSVSVAALSVALLISLSVVCSVSHGQTQVLVETPYHRNGNSFYENFGVGWNFRNDNFFINVPNGVRPPFGMGDPNADAQLNFSGRGPGGGLFGLNFTMGQGNTRTNSVTTPMVMVPNGGTGAIFDGSVRPFVTGFIPVVGGFGGGGFGGGGFNGFGGGYVVPATSVSPLQQKLERMAIEGQTLGDESVAASQPQVAELDQVAQAPRERTPTKARSGQRSSAEQGDISVAEIRRQQAAKSTGENAPFAVIERKAIANEAAGKLHSARNGFKRAAQQAPEEHRARLADEYHRVSRRIESKKSQ